MNNFMNAMKMELNNEKTFTSNGAVAYKTSGKELLDFNFAVSAMRNEFNEIIKQKYSGVYFEDPLVAVKFLFWLRDCRGGNGERKIFRACLEWLAENKPNVAMALIGLVPEYGRWDDLWVLLDTDLRDDVVEFVRKKLEEDMELSMSGKPISLLEKWMPSINTSSAVTKRYAKILCEGLALSERGYRKTLSKLREYLDVVERKMTAKEWSEIDYSKVPSQANIKYSNAFLRNDEERRREFLASLVKGETKINAGTLQPHEIVSKYTNSTCGWSSAVKPYDEALEQLWKALPDVTLNNTLVVRDGSGSMTGGYGTKVRPLDVATALTIYMADHNTGIWKDKFITFSANPQMIDLSNCETLHDKLVQTYSHDDCENTDIEKVMMLVLNTAKRNHLSQDEMPGRIVICSDMQFDSCCVVYDRSTRTRWGYPVSHYADETLFETIAKRYKDAGYLMPKICFWNLSGSINGTIPMQQNELGVVLASGFSVQIMKMFMSGETDPYKVLLETINSERYDAVEQALSKIS